MADYFIREGDALLSLDYVFIDSCKPLDLTTATVEVSVYAPGQGTPILTEAAVAVDPVQGKARFTPSGPLALATGSYFVLWKATIDGKVVTHPVNGFLVLLVSGEASAFTYSGNPGARPLDHLRFLLQDTDEAEAEFNDAELLFLLDAERNPYRAARTAAETLAARYVGEASVSKKVGDLSLSQTYTDRAAQYRELAAQFAAAIARSSPPMPVVNPNALRPTAGKQHTTQGTDFYLGVHDNNTLEE